MLTAIGPAETGWCCTSPTGILKTVTCSIILIALTSACCACGRVKSNPKYSHADHKAKKALQKRLRTFRNSIVAGDKNKVQKAISELGSDIMDLTDLDGMTAYMLSCQSNETHITELLVAQGCDTSIHNPKRRDMTGWDLAVSTGNLETFDLLCNLARHVTNQAHYTTTSSHVTYPKLADEFQSQRLRRHECQQNRGPGRATCAAAKCALT